MSAGSRWSWPPCSRYGDSGTKSPGPKYSRGGEAPGVSCLSWGRAEAGDLWIEFFNFDIDVYYKWKYSLLNVVPSAHMTLWHSYHFNAVFLEQRHLHWQVVLFAKILPINLSEHVSQFQVDRPYEESPPRSRIWLHDFCTRIKLRKDVWSYQKKVKSDKSWSPMRLLGGTPHMMWISMHINDKIGEHYL